MAAGVVLVLIVVTVLSVVVYLQITHQSVFAIPPPSIGQALGLQLIIDAGVIAFLLYALPRLSRLSLRGLGFTAPAWWQVGVAVLGALAMILVVNVLGGAIETLFHVKHEQSVVKLALSIRSPALKATFAIVALIGAPLMEELSFRVFAFNAVRRHWGFWGGALVSGLFFGLAHWDQYAFVPLALGGIILCVVYYRTRNAWMSMITHALFNSVTIFAIFLNPALLKQ